MTTLRNLEDARDFIRSERSNQDLDQAQLAERANVARQTIGNFENGGDIKLSTLFKLVRSLNGELSAQANPSVDDTPDRPSFGV